MITAESPESLNQHERQGRRITRRLLLTFAISAVVLVLVAVLPPEQRFPSPKPNRPSPAPLLIRNRSFISNPLTANESEILARRDETGIRAAVCHRTLFTGNSGNISLDPLFPFVSYYILLGFDHVFFFYRPNVAELSRFDELSNLPYVTMTEYTGYGKEEGQKIVEMKCLSDSKFAADYNWVLTVDADEYLWLGSKKKSVKKFLSAYDSANYTFLSFGKWMYTRLYSNEADVDGAFGLEPFAFTAKSHCHIDLARHRSFPQNVTYTYCPWQYGRAKVLAKPAHHRKVNIHGMSFNYSKPGLLHFDTSVAHLKEWRSVLLNHPQHIQYRPPIDFNATSVADIVDFHRTHEKVDGKVLIHYDSELREWMSAVASGVLLQTFR